MYIPSEENNTSSLDDLHEYIQKIPLIQKYVKSVDIRQLYVGNQTYIIQFDNQNIYVDSDQFNISLRPNFNNDVLNLQLYSLFIKEQELLFEGSIRYDLAKNNSLFDGKYFYHNLQGSITSIIDSDFINFHINSSTLQDITFIKDFVRLDKEIESWMYDNVKGKFKFNFLNGKIAINETGLEVIELSGDANVTNAKVKYHKKLEAVETPLLNIQYKDDNLYFSMQKPTYKGIKLYGSEVIIYGLTKDKPYINIDLSTKNKLSKEIIEIIEAYGGSIPIIQTDGTTDSKLRISVKLYGDYGVDLYGEFFAKNSNFRINDFAFFANEANVILDNDLLKINDSLVQYEDNLKLKLNLQINLKQKNAVGEAKNVQYLLGNNEYEFINAQGINSKLFIDFKNDLKIDIQDFDISLVNKQDQLDVALNSLNKLFGYSKFLQEKDLRFGSAFLKIYSKDMLDFNAKLKNLNLPLYDKQQKQVKSLELIGSVKKTLVKFSTLDNTISYTNEPNKLIIKNLDLKYRNDGTQNQLSRFVIEGKNSNILFDGNKKILANSYDINLQSKEVKSLKAKYKDVTVDIQDLPNTRRTVSIKNISPEFFKAITGKDFVQQGQGDLYLDGKNGMYNGTMHLKNVLIKTAQNGVKTNGTPENKNAQTSMNEYFIYDGRLMLAYDENTQNLSFFDIKTQGNGLDLKGSMLMNLETKKVSGEFEASFFKTASKVIGSIPLVNYLLLGDDKKISLDAKVSGTLEDMQISTNAAQSTIAAPFSIFGRVLTLPFKAIDTVVNPNKE